MKHPFINDPFAIVWQAFENLYPGKQDNVTVQWYPMENGSYGVTNFADDGTIDVCVDPNLNVQDAVEILAHELAHIAVGYESGHGEQWNAAFDAIQKEYYKIGYSMYGGNSHDE